MMNNTGLYIHVPFCLSKCPYCDFYSISYDRETAEKYTRAVIRNLRFYSENYGVKCDTVYFGGGTPILLYDKIGEILESVDICEDAEITVEANPCVTDKTAIEMLKKSGVNRISFGVQSLSDEELRFLGRKHTAEEAKAAILTAYDSGIENISVDLMLGLSGQTDQTVRNSVEKLSDLPISHISAYLLKIEENTPFYRMKLDLPDEDDTSEIYLYASELLEEKGFFRYEISNFAHKGKESRHNLKYWRCEEYIGIGPAAHSYFGGKRFSVDRDIESFISSPIQETVITDDNPRTFEEYAMLKLRLSEGITYKECESFGIEKSDMEKKLRLIPKNYVTADEKGIRLTSEGFLLSNPIIAKLIY